MARPSRFPAEVRQRAAICSIAEKFGVTGETLRQWVRRAEGEVGQRAVISTPVLEEELVELARLRRENAELRRANEILKSAAAFFAAELDRPSDR